VKATKLAIENNNFSVVFCKFFNSKNQILGNEGMMLERVCVVYRYINLKRYREREEEREAKVEYE
jgi:hypothetical protein